MKHVALGCTVIVAVLALAGGMALAQAKGEPKLKALPQTPEWQKLRSLAGEWEGSMQEGGQKIPAQLEVRLTADGSAVMHVMGKGTPHEMVTMFHPDGERVLATHYCSAHNQPRMALTKAAAANQVAFEFVDGTNLEPGDVHMVRLVLTFTDADHHDELWTATVNGKDGPPALFRYARKK